MKRLVTVTSDVLEDLHVCSTHMAKFKRLFPNGCKVTEANIFKAVKGGLDLVSFCSRLGRKKVFRKAAYERYKKQIDDSVCRYWTAEETIADACRGRAPKRGGTVYDWAIYKELMVPFRERQDEEQARITSELLLKGWKGA